MRDVIAPAGVGSANGTGGELVQGVLGDRDVMVTFPVQLPVTATAHRTPAPGVVVWPPCRHKARRAVETLRTAHLDPDGPGVLVQIASPIPVGKGMASSSADIVAACRAVAQLHGLDLAPHELSAIACGIEPTDGIMYDNPVAYDFMCGELLHDPARELDALAVVIDSGTCLDTLALRRRPYNPEERAALSEAYDLVLDGLAAGDLAAVGAAATASARINQRRVPKPDLEALLEVAEAYGGAGVATAHSGTILTLLFDAGRRAEAHAAGAAAQRLMPSARVTCLRSGTGAGVLREAA
jgi:L-threonine kinase